MGFMTIDGRKVEFTDEKNVLSVIRKAGINLPTLCYHSEVSTFGAAGSALWRMTGDVLLPPAQRFPEMEWSSIPIPEELKNTEN